MTAMRELLWLVASKRDFLTTSRPVSLLLLLPVSAPQVEHHTGLQAQLMGLTLINRNKRLLPC